ncbi:MAG: DNA polymerase III [Parcubacteria group bacterium RIFCSPLOWO2_02_FULL_40_12]|nr:MAG: DNA polymerase III [Parcubacteria group bacterium RIFCSPLOWO2_02_FULL_40_12]
MNPEIAKILYEMAILLDMKEVAFKPRAYEKAAIIIEGLEEDIKDIYKKGGLKALMEISGIGQGIAEKIEEYIKTKRIKDFERLKKQTPVDINGLTSIEGLGPKSIFKLYKKLGIKTVEGLEKAAKAGELRGLEGFGEKSEQKILKGIEFAKKGQGRFILGFVSPTVKSILERIRGLPYVEITELAGSIRRMQETVGDLDILVISKEPEKVMDYFVKMPEVVHIYGKGPTKTNIRLKNGMDADLRVLEPKSFGAALQYFTGDKYHNIALREVAIKKGYKLSEYGLFKGRKVVAAKTEKEIYEKLGFKWIPPEIRTNSGELDAARERKLPKLIEYGSLKGDLQVQTDWTDGQNSIKEMAEAAKKAGLKYIVITDHTKSLAMTGGLDEKKILRQMVEIDKVNKEVSGIKILKGAEVNILKDGKMDISDEVLAKLDVVGGAVHSNFNLSEKEQTERIIKAMENPNVDIIFHPTGRVIQKREAYKVDMNELIKVAKRTKTVLEIDAFPNRLDLKDEYIRKAVQAGIKLSIDSDAHNILHFQYLELGIAQARRGWTESKDIINTRSWEEMLKLLK